MSVNIKLPSTEELNKIKLIALDMDGTALNEHHLFSDITKKTIAELTKKGYEVVLASGRSYDSMVPFHEELKLTTPIISYNGSFIKNPHTNEIIMKKTVPPSIVEEAFQLARKKDIFIQFYDGEIPLYQGDEIFAAHNSERTGITGKRYEEKKFSLDNCIKGMFIAHEDQHELLEALQKEIEHISSWQGEVLTVFSSVNYLEILNINASKKLALDALLKSNYSFGLEAVCSFGDALNDFDMLMASGIGVAMENAFPKLLQEVTWKTISNKKNGVAYFLEKAFLS